MPPMQMVSKTIGDAQLSENAFIHPCTQHLNPHIVFKNKHYWPYTKYKNIYLNYK